MYHVWDDKVTIDCWRNNDNIQDFDKILHPAWQNMVDSIDDDLDHYAYNKEVDRIMRKYKARMIRPRTFPHYMRFPNEKMAMWFLLEWS